MNPSTSPYDPSTNEQLAQIIDRARIDNGILAQVSRTELSSDMTTISQIFSAVDKPTGQQEVTHWDMIQEEYPLPTRRYKFFDKALHAKDPLAALRERSRDRRPSEIYLLQVRINSRARSNPERVEKNLPKLATAEWSDLTKV